MTVAKIKDYINFDLEIIGYNSIDNTPIPYTPVVVNDMVSAAFTSMYNILNQYVIQITNVKTSIINANISFLLDSNELDVTFNSQTLTLTASPLSLLDTDYSSGTKSLNISALNNGTFITKKNINLFIHQRKFEPGQDFVEYLIEDPTTNENTLAYDLSYSIWSAASEYDVIDNSIKNAYTTQDHTNGIYIRNTNCWAADFDWTGVSPWNSLDQNRRAGTLISPRHIVTAKHYPLTVGTTIRFITNDNVVVERTIADFRYPTSDIYPGQATDLQICSLDSDVPNTIKHYRVLDTRTSSISGKLVWGNYVPKIYFDQEEKILLNRNIVSSSSPIPTPSLNRHGAARLRSGSYKYRMSYVNDFYRRIFWDFATSYRPSFSQLDKFNETVIIGDSGNPSFYVLNGEPLIEFTFLGSNSTNGGGSGPALIDSLNTINTAMTEMGGGYQLDVVSVSNYPDVL